MNNCRLFRPLCRICIVSWRQKSTPLLLRRHQDSKLLMTAISNFSRVRFYSTEQDEDQFEYVIEDSDVFGDIAKKHNVKVFDFEQEFAADNEAEVTRSRRNTPYWFHLQCRKLARTNKIFECVEMLEVRMLKVDRVDPEERNFSVVIGALSKIGHTEKAFALYKKLKEYGLEPSLACYTALFNCVANSKSKDDFVRAKFLRKNLQEKKILLNRMTYNAMIKAYSKHASVKETFEVFRDSIAAGSEPDSYTFSFLIKCCGKDKETGFLRALQVWRNMVVMGVQPKGKLLTDFLGIMYKCGVGDPGLATSKLLSENSDTKQYENFLTKHVRQFRWLKGQESSPNPKKLIEDKSNISEPLKIEGVTVKQIEDETQVKEPQDTAQPTVGGASISIANKEPATICTTTIPNVLSPNQNKQISGIVSIRDCSKPSQRLQLIGGMEGVFKLMKENKIPPSIKIFSILAKSLNPSTEDENKLMTIAEKLKSELDVDFYNCIMHRRCLRRKLEEAREILLRMEKHDLTPDHRTWCIYAMTCTTFKDGKRFLEMLSENEINPDLIIFHTLINATLRNRTNFYLKGTPGVQYPDYFYLCFLINELKKYEISANKRLVEIFEKVAAWPEGYDRWNNYNEKFEKQLKLFRKKYSGWLKETGVNIEKEYIDEVYRPTESCQRQTANSIQSQRFLNQH